MSLCESRSRLENVSAYEQSNRPSDRTRSARAVALLQPVSRGGPPAVVLSFAKSLSENASLIAIDARLQSGFPTCGIVKSPIRRRVAPLTELLEPSCVTHKETLYWAPQEEHKIA